MLARLGLPDTPITVSMPHPRLSLTHTGDLAIAVGACCAQQAGIGVDIEYLRPIDIRSARFFLDDDELARWPGWAVQQGAGPAVQQVTLQRLWTVKEAVFKAHLANAGRQLRDYRISSLHPEARAGVLPGDPWIGRARCGPDTFGVRSLVVDDLILTVALCERTTS